MRGSKVADFSIRYDAPHQVYHAGSQVRGTVRLQLAKPMALQSIKVFVHGFAKVKWPKSSGDDNKYYRARRIYIEKQTWLFNQDVTADASFKLSEGVHQYDFSADIPESAPSSLECKYGYIRYYCEATIGRSIYPVDMQTKVPFTVIKHLDLNTQPDIYRHPAEGQDASENICLCCVRGDVTAYFKVYKRAFVPGEPIVFHAKVVNNSNAQLNWSSVTLVQDGVFYGASDSWMSSGELKPKNKTMEVVARFHPGPVPGHTTDVWDDEKLFIPSVPPSYIEGCDIINISYAVQFSVHVPYGTNLKVGTDIVIGTVPLQRSSQRRPTRAAALRQPASVALPPAEHTAATPNVVFDLMPPPSYEECISGKIQILEEAEPEDAAGGFIPRYAFYDYHADTSLS